MTEKEILHRAAITVVNSDFHYLKGNNSFDLWLNIYIDVFLDKEGYDYSLFTSGIKETIQDRIDDGTFSPFDTYDSTEKILEEEERRQNFFNMM